MDYFPVNFAEKVGLPLPAEVARMARAQALDKFGKISEEM